MSRPAYWLSPSVLTMKSAPQLEAGVDAGHERRRQPLAPREPDDVIDADGRGHLRRAVARPVVDDEDLDASMPGIARGRSASVAGSVSASLRHGIWMISFVTIAICGWIRHQVPDTKS